MVQKHTVLKVIKRKGIVTINNLFSSNIPVSKIQPQMPW